MENYSILIVAFLVLIFIGLIHRKSIAPITKGNDNVKKIEKENGKETFRPIEPPHLLRRLGLSPPNCPFRDQY
jgi:hypothetical protein